MTEALLHVENLQVRFHGHPAPAVAGVDLSLEPGAVLALLGESGCGKSVTLRALLRLLPARTAQVSGRIRVAGADVLNLAPAALRAYRGGTVSMVFQEPMLAFDPVYPLGQQIAETIVRHKQVSHGAALRQARELFDRVRIPAAAERLRSYPHEMSGGMLQRAMIALALSCGPRVLLADEPTTALDATVQIQILTLLRELQQEMGMAVIFVTHDIGVAAEVADRIGVMYAGRVVETGEVRSVLRSPQHPYTQGLIASSVHGAGPGARLRTIPGAPPGTGQGQAGCAFAPRCQHATARCGHDLPLLVPATRTHRVACHLHHATEVALATEDNLD